METIDKNYAHYKLNLRLLSPLFAAEEPPDENDDGDYDDHYLPWQLNPLEQLEAPDFDDFRPTPEDIADFEEEALEYEQLNKDEINKLLDEVEI